MNAIAQVQQAERDRKAALAAEIPAQEHQPPSREQKKIEALEGFVVTHLCGTNSKRSDQFHMAARNLVDLLSDDMTEAETDAAFLLIRYAKRHEAEAMRATAAEMAQLQQAGT